uniref:Uncharacterized protein n=1 Tax=Rhizophora mucronata TaxID=61149 RepID=A0A2P2Q712_RHIMU
MWHHYTVTTTAFSSDELARHSTKDSSMPPTIIMFPITSNSQKYFAGVNIMEWEKNRRK